MVFNSIVFAVFFAGVFVVYWRAPLTWRNPFLLVASYVFYGWWDWRFLSLLVISTVADFTIGRRMSRAQPERRRKQLLALSAVINLGILGVFKYANFFIDSFSTAMASVGFGEVSAPLRVVLPVGISFYTFQTLSYTFDIFRKRIEPTSSIIDFATYVAYFPQLVAGPIERARHLLPQIQQTDRPRPRGERLSSSIELITVGLFKKVVLADGVAPIVNEVFASPEEFSGLALAMGVIAFSIQIYGDFSGYTDIARGVSKLLGIDLVLNFRQPYLARNITEFWRRWHISLSNWLRDYLYIPLGGNRRGSVATLRNLMITMLLGGLWHGASWNFVVWGGLHGLYLIVHKLVRGGRVNDDLHVSVRQLPSILGTFAVVNFAWIFFRAETFTAAFEVIRGIATLQGGSLARGDLLLVVALGLVAVMVDMLMIRNGQETFVSVRNPARAGFAFGAAVIAIVVFSGGAPEPFIYFQF